MGSLRDPSEEYAVGGFLATLIHLRSKLGKEGRRPSPGLWHRQQSKGAGAGGCRVQRCSSTAYSNSGAWSGAAQYTPHRASSSIRCTGTSFPPGAPAPPSLRKLIADPGTPKSRGTRRGQEEPSALINPQGLTSKEPSAPLINSKD